MEGVGSRLGRGSSRYGQTPAFTGPVRKWKKRWVHVSSSPTTNLSFRGSHRNKDSAGNNNGNAHSLYLCRWTPISTTHTDDADKDSANEEEQPRRKFRYTPIVMLEENKKEAIRNIKEESKRDDDIGNLKINDVLMEEIQASGKDQSNSKRGSLDLDISLNGDDDNPDSDVEENEADSVTKGGVWTLV